MGTFLVQVPQKVHRKLKKKCMDMEIYQGEAVSVLVELFIEGSLNVSLEKIEERARQSRGIQDGDVCGSHNAAGYLNVSVPTVRRMIDNGQLKAKKIPPIHGGLVFKKVDLDKAKKKREQ